MMDVFEGCADALFSEVGRIWGASEEVLARARFDVMPKELVESVSKLILAGMTLGNRAARKAREEPRQLPTIDQMAGSDPNFTGEETTAEYLREIGRTGEEPK